MEPPCSEPVRSEILHIDRGKGITEDDPTGRPACLHLLDPSAPCPLLTGSSTSAGIRMIFIKLLKKINLLNCSGEGTMRLEGLIVPLEMHEISSQSITMLANYVLQCTLQVMFSALSFFFFFA